MKLIIPRALKAEHEELNGMLKRAILLSGKTGKVVDFAERLMEHAKMEEEILYPTAILIGEYLKLKL